MQDTAVQMGHGGGGWLSRELIREEIVPRFGEGPLQGLPDGARLRWGQAELVFTTDSFVVQPLFFPGGNIGELAVFGTVNDLAVSGARVRYLSVGLIIEEGFSRSRLASVLDAIRSAARSCGAVVATGDTKVVPRGQCDGLYINTAGVGECLPGFDLDRDRIAAGDHVLVSGPLGDHGMAVLAARGGINIQVGPASDAASVLPLVEALLPWAGEVRFMRDPTRGGAAAVLNELVEERALEVKLREADLPFAPATRAAAEMLGLDLLTVACEGRIVLVCDARVSDAVLAAWRATAEGRGAARIGVIVEGRGRVLLETLVGGQRLVDVPRGELLPRIC